MTKIGFQSVEEYFAAIPNEEAKKCLQRIRKTILDIVPDAEEVISYQIPTFKFHGPLVGFAAFKNHCSLFPLNGHTVQKFQSKLQNFRTSKAAIQFSPKDPIPESLLREIVEYRLSENLSKP